MDHEPKAKRGGVPYLSYWILDDLGEVGLTGGQILAVMVAMSRLGPATTRVDVPVEWVAKKSQQSRGTVGRAFARLRKYEMVTKTRKENAGQCAEWDFELVIASHERGQERAHAFSEEKKKKAARGSR